MRKVSRKTIQRRRRNSRKTRKTSYGGSKLSFNTHTPKYPPGDINNLISHVIYMNLTKRTDRKKHIERELSVFDPSKVTRLAAVEEAVPTTGCAKSHLKALQMARDKGYDNVLIIEDDAFWINVDEAYPVLKRLMSQPYDGIMLTALNPDYNKDTLRLRGAVSATGYVVNKAFYPKIIKLFEDALSNEHLKRHNSAGSYVWANGITRNAHSRGIWYLVVPYLLSQIPGHSNIDGKSVNWVSAFDSMA